MRMYARYTGTPARSADRSAVPEPIPVDRARLAARLLRAGCPALQAQPVVSRAGDPSEQEADRVATRVVGMTSRPLVSPGRTEGREVPGPRGGQRDLAGLLGSGRALDRPNLDFFEPRFAHDFGQVRVFDGPRAAAAASAVGARAFTVGRDVAFAAGEYVPQSARGRHLLAHELTHVVQQSSVAGTRAGTGRKASPVAVSPAPAHVIYRAQPEATSAPARLPFELTGNEAGKAGARHAANELEQLLSGPVVLRALATIPITDARQKDLVIQQVMHAPATLRALAEAGKVRALSADEHKTGVDTLGFPGLADAFADAGSEFLYISPLGRPSPWTMGHEVSHLQTGPVPAGGADPELAAKLWNLNTEVRAAFVDYAIVKLGDMRDELAAGKSEDQAVAAFAQRYSERIFDYVARHGSVSSSLDKLARVVSARRGAASVPINVEALRLAVAKGIVSEADLQQIFSHQTSPFDVEPEPFEIEGL